MSPASTADETLLRNLQAGRRRAFERLYRDYRAPVYNVCARMLGDREEAEDVTQEVFIKAFRKLPVEQVRSLRPWMYRVATNACLNQLRARRNDVGGAPVEEVPATVDAFEQARAAAYVEQTLAGLNDRYRAALVLKDLQGLRSDEIADVLEVSPGTADVLVHRARAAFKRGFAKVAGETPAPASLGLVLGPLALPGVLQQMPHLVHLALPAGGALAKLTAALTTKAAIGVAAAGLLVGGGVAVDQLVVQPSHLAAHAAEVTVTATQVAAHNVSGTTRHSTAKVQRWAGHGCSSGEACRDDRTSGDDAAEHDRSREADDHDAGSAATHDAGEASGSSDGGTAHGSDDTYVAGGTSSGGSGHDSGADHSSDGTDGDHDSGHDGGSGGGG